METKQISKQFQSFEECKFEFEGAEAWHARDLMKLLGYPTWQHFRPVILRAWEACDKSKPDNSRHFLVGDCSQPWKPNEVFTVNRKNSLGGRPSEDVIVTRYGAYLIAMNGDPRKEQVAFAQHYFALATRSFELIQQRMQETSRLEARKQLSETEARFQGVLFEHDVNGKGIARIRSRGDKVLFGGHSTEEMKQKWNVPKSRPLSDFADEVVIVAKQLGAAMTAHNTKVNNIKGEEKITKEHLANNQTIRKGLNERDIYPENLPPEEDIKKVERRHKSEVKKLTRSQKIQKVS